MLAPRRRHPAPPGATGRAVRCCAPGFAVLAGVNLAIGGFFGAIQISVTAFAAGHGAAGTAAALFTVSSCAGVLAGWLYGLRRWRAAPQVQLTVAAATGWAVDSFGAHGGFAVAAVATGVMAMLAVTGLRALRVPQQQAAATQ